MVLVDSGRMVLEKLSEEVFDVELMDVQMPEMDGFEATASIRRNEEVASFTGLKDLTITRWNLTRHPRRGAGAHRPESQETADRHPVRRSSPLLSLRRPQSPR